LFSLLAPANSLFWRENSLLGREKFPARACREFGASRLNLLGNSQRKASQTGNIFEIPC
jgi:hypothetical protein